MFVDADYESNKEATNVVEELTSNNFANAKIIITTPVMDNGISFHDIELKNIVILADTEESFIQMLGRKRISEGKEIELKVYVCKRDVKHFKRRLAYVDRIINFYENHKEVFKWRSIISDPITHEKTEVTPYIMERGCISLSPICQQNFLREIFENEQAYKKATKFCYVLSGVVAANMFAIERFYSLRAFYDELIKKLEIDPDAFLKLQQSWLKKADEVVDITDCKTLVSAEYRKEIERSLEQLLGEKLDVEGNKKLKQDKNFLKALQFFLRESGDYKKTELDALKKSDRGIPVDLFNKCMGSAGLYYKMHKPDGSHFIIEKVASSS